MKRALKLCSHKLAEGPKRNPAGFVNYVKLAPWIMFLFCLFPSSFLLPLLNTSEVLGKKVLPNVSFRTSSHRYLRLQGAPLCPSRGWHRRWQTAGTALASGCPQPCPVTRGVTSEDGPNLSAQPLPGFTHTFLPFLIRISRVPTHPHIISATPPADTKSGAARRLMETSFAVLPLISLLCCKQRAALFGMCQHSVPWKHEPGH